MGFNVTVDTSVSEELQDILTTNAWQAVLDIVAADCIQSRRALLTALTLTETQRISHVTKLKAYKYLFEQIFQLAGKSKLPTKYLELFTGAETE
jgi:hypothetical protein